VDDFDQSLYATQSSVGLFIADATPHADAGFFSVDPLPSARLLAPLGALSVYQGRGGGYLLVTSGGDNTFAAYTLGARSFTGFVGRFTVVAGPSFGAVEGSTGQTVESFGIGNFPQGLFVAEDNAGSDTPDLKLVSWADAADAGGLVVDATNDPRGDAGVVDGGSDAGTDGGADAGTDAGTGGTGPTGTPPPSTTPPQSTGCSAAGGVAASLFALFALVLIAARRRRA
jgi:MYXO-CTERM domain-containing protein